MSNPESYYPASNEGRADWWQNLLSPAAAAAFAGMGAASADVTAITDDAQQGVYVYRTARVPYDNFYSQIVAYLNQIASAPEASPAPSSPPLPSFVAPPDVSPPCGFEIRRPKWVAALKTLAGYTVSGGLTLGIEAAATPFDPATYKALLYGLSSPAARVLAGKFRKAYGRIDALNLYGRPAGTIAMKLIKTCLTATFTATVPLVGSGPEAWEFLGRAVIKDAEIGIPSDIVPMLIHG